MTTEEQPGISFAGFVISLATTAAVHFGDIPDPSTGEPQEPIFGGPGRDVLAGTDASESFHPGGGFDRVTLGSSETLVFSIPASAFSDSRRFWRLRMWMR